jgi:chitin synthase
MANPKPCSYLAVADGEKQLNMAKVYAGHYNGTPCITVVKCGTEEEQKGAKAGNRGKRDSQVILMSFFQRVLFNDRFCELDYEMFWKMTWLMKGVTPDKFETVLMVKIFIFIYI